MRKPLHTVGLVSAGFLTACALLYANDGLAPLPRRSAQPEAQPAADRGGRESVEVAFQDAKVPAKKAGAADPRQDMGWLGIMLEQDQGGGIRIQDVFPGGPAAFAGVRIGDMLERVDQTAVSSVDKAVNTIESLVPGRKVTLTVKRQGKPVKLSLTVASLLDFHQHYVSEMSQRDARDPNFAEFHGVRENDMSIEVIRRLFEQNQRTEATLQRVLAELQALRKEVRERGK